MSSYFDALQRQIREAREHESDAAFRETLIAVDAQLFREVVAITGDREFPDDLRERILKALAVYGCWQPGNTKNEKQIERDMMFSFSQAIEEVHSLFHEVARRRVQTRFGLLSDSPTQIAVLRDEYDAEKRS